MKDKIEGIYQELTPGAQVDQFDDSAQSYEYMILKTLQGNYDDYQDMDNMLEGLKRVQRLVEQTQQNIIHDHLKNYCHLTEHLSKTYELAPLAQFLATDLYRFLTRVFPDYEEADNLGQIDGYYEEWLNDDEDSITGEHLDSDALLDNKAIAVKMNLHI